MNGPGFFTWVALWVLIMVYLGWRFIDPVKNGKWLYDLNYSRFACWYVGPKASIFFNPPYNCDRVNIMLDDDYVHMINLRLWVLVVVTFILPPAGYLFVSLTDKMFECIFGNPNQDHRYLTTLSRIIVNEKVQRGGGASAAYPETVKKRRRMR